MSDKATISNIIETEGACGHDRNARDRSEDVDEAIVSDHLAVNAVQVNLINKPPSLLRNPGIIDDTLVTIILDCRSSTNVIRLRLAFKVISMQRR